MPPIHVIKKSGGSAGGSLRIPAFSVLLRDPDRRTVSPKTPPVPLGNRLPGVYNLSPEHRPHRLTRLGHRVFIPAMRVQIPLGSLSQASSSSDLSRSEEEEACCISGLGSISGPNGWPSALCRIGLSDFCSGAGPGVLTRGLVRWSVTLPIGDRMLTALWSGFPAPLSGQSVWPRLESLRHPVSPHAGWKFCRGKTKIGATWAG